MSKQSVSKRGKIVQFPGTQPFTYKGRKVHLIIGVWPEARGIKKCQLDENGDCYSFLISAVNFEQAMILSSQLADELGVCLEGG